MSNHLVAYLSQFASLGEEEIRIIEENNVIRAYEKGHVLLSEGQVAKECFLVLKGCVRSYYLKEGEENITEFYTEGQPIVPVSYTHQEPSAYFLSCVEPCLLSSGNQQKTQQFLQQFPQFVPVFMELSDKLLAYKQVSFDTYRNLSPEVRYQKLLDTRPELVHRVPQYMIASYLGIKPESLSRIRRRNVMDN